MTRIDDFIQLKAFARQDGAILALLWIASFACTAYMPDNGIGSILLLLTPFAVGWRLCSFRNYALDGHISFRRSYAYSVYTFIYASLIFAIAQYVYFRFLDHGAFARTIVNTLTLYPTFYLRAGITPQELKDYADMVQGITPVQWAFFYMMMNISLGIVTAIPIAGVCMKREKDNA